MIVMDEYMQLDNGRAAHEIVRLCDREEEDDCVYVRVGGRRQNYNLL